MAAARRARYTAGMMRKRNPFALPARVAAFLLGGVCFGCALLAQGGRFNGWLDVLTHFAPMWLLGALLAAAWAAVGERGATRGALLLLAAGGVLMAGALMVPELTRAMPPAAARAVPYRLRLIQFNAWDKLADPRPAADWIDAERPDVVTMEEVTPGLRTALIRRGFQCTRGMVNVAIFSRARRLPHPFLIPLPNWRTLPGFARATFASADGGAPFTVVAVHLDWPTLARHWSQPLAFAALLARYPSDRLILAGDFNLTPWSFALRRLDGQFGPRRRDRAIPTWPAAHRIAGRLEPLPAVLPIDHVYAGEGWRTVSVTRGPRLGSDHFPLVIDLALANPVTRPAAGGP